MNKKFTCIVCPNGCEIDIDYDSKNIKRISGYLCEKGKEYVIKEIYSPKRILTTTIKVKNGEISRVSVKTSKPIPKNLMFEIMKEISKLCVEAPIKIGDIIVHNILNTNADIIATKNVKISKNERTCTFRG